jgi:chromate transporter
MSTPPGARVRLSTIVRQWGRIGLIGFGGPPAHIVLFRKLCVDERAWLTAHEFEDGIAATSLLPGPASTQLAIYCAWRLRGRGGAIIGGLSFILPGLTIILALSALFLSAHPPLWVLGIAAGAGAAVPVVAVHAAQGLLPASWRRAGPERAEKVRWSVYFLAGGVSAATVGPLLVLVLVICGALEIAVRTRGAGGERRRVSGLIPTTVLPVVRGGLASLSWVAFKVGALSYGGGFVIIPLMQHDAVATYHWMSGAQFLNAVALGQVTPGPVVQTVAVVGYAASGLWGGLLAAGVAFAPSFVFVIAGARCSDTGVLHRSGISSHRRHCRFGNPPRPRVESSMAARCSGVGRSLAPGSAKRSGGRVAWGGSHRHARRSSRCACLTLLPPIAAGSAAFCAVTQARGRIGRTLGKLAPW